MAFLKAELLPGSRMVLDALHFETHLAAANLVMTAEGHLDTQTLRGKSVGAVAAAAAAKTRSIPVIVVVGGVSNEEHALYEMGIAAIVPLQNEKGKESDVNHNWLYRLRDYGQAHGA